jgi:hypothetical protein
LRHRRRVTDIGAGEATKPAESLQALRTARALPLLSAAILIVAGMLSSLIGPTLLGRHGWALPYDLWGTATAASRLLHLHVAGLYEPPTALITFPGAALILLPSATLATFAHLSLASPGPANEHPALWLVTGPWMMALSSSWLFAADAAARRLQISLGRRVWLQIASGAVLWNVSVQWGHPEDAVAVGFLLWAVLSLADRRMRRAGYALGAAIAIQPLVLLAVPILMVGAGRRHIIGLLLRGAAPATVLLAVALAANRRATWHAITAQPNWPAVDHATPLIVLSRPLAGGAVTAGPARLIAIAVASLCAIALARQRIVDHQRPWSPSCLRHVLWWVAMSLAVRCAFEPVMVAFYLWPGLALALVVAADRWRVMLAASTVAIATIFGAQVVWRNEWGWWSLTLLGLALTLAIAYPRQPRSASLIAVASGSTVAVATPS